MTNNRKTITISDESYRHLDAIDKNRVELIMTPEKNIRDLKIYNMMWTFDDLRHPYLKVLTTEGVQRLGFPFLPYFFVKTGNDYQKIEAKDPTHLKVLAERQDSSGSQTFEADVLFPLRVMIDLGLTISLPDRYLVYDIEVQSTEGFPEPKEAKYRILAICGVGSDGKEYSFVDSDEKKMISDFLKVAMDYKIIAGWNTTKFDIPYIDNRCKKLGIYFDPFAIVNIDLLAGYKYLVQYERMSFSLDAVAKYEKIGAKMDLGPKMSVSELFQLFHTDREKLVAYCLNDCHLAYRINQKFKIIDIFFEIAQRCHCFPSNFFYLDGDGMVQTSLLAAIESLCLKKANTRNIRLPTGKSQKMPGVSGAIVIEPSKLGVIDNVCLLDYASLYPTIIRSFNIGMDTYRPDKSGGINAPLGSFDKSTRSFMGSTIEELMDLKASMGAKKSRAKKGTDEHAVLERQYHVTKILLNSIYGVMGYSKSKLYKKECFENVLLIARIILAHTMNLLRESGYEPIMGDTDSVFFQVKNVKEGEEIAAKVEKQIHEFLTTYNVIEPENFKLELEKFFSRLVVVAKKKYAGHVIYEDKKCSYVYKRGLESVRHDWPQAVRVFQDNLLKCLLFNENHWGLVSDTKKQLFAGELDKDLPIYKTLKQPPEAYVPLTPHARCAIMLEREGKRVRVGDKIGYVKFGSDKTEVYPVWEGVFPKLRSAEYEYIWNKQFEPIIERFSLSRNKSLLDFT